MLKIIYIFFLGIILATFVGVGIATFYPAPKAPEPPVFYEQIEKRILTDEEKQQEQAFIQAQKAYQKDFAQYSRNVSIASLGFAIIFLVISLIFAPKMDILSDGLLLGGVFTLVYSVIRGFMSEDTTYRFIVVSVGLIAAIILGYIKFIRPKRTAI